ncbi:MAG: metallophosphoesterase family protein [Thermoguttaceae bacterium]
MKSFWFVLVTLFATGVLIADDTSSADVWVLAADPHVGAVAGAEKEQLFADFDVAVLALTPRPAGVLWLGDNAASRGLADDYKQFMALLKPLHEAGFVFDATLGDHDRRDGFFAAVPWAVRPEDNKHLIARKIWRDCPTIQQRYVNVIETPHFNWFVLDVCSPEDNEQGRLGQRQLAWLAAELNARPDKPAILLAHHPIDSIPLSCVIDSKQLRAVLREHPQVKAYIYGHTHVWMKIRSEGMHVINIPALNVSAKLGTMKTAVPAMFAVVTLREDGFQIAVHKLGDNVSKPTVFDFPSLR